MIRKSYATFILVSSTIPLSKISCMLMQVPTAQTIIFRLVISISYCCLKLSLLYFFFKITTFSRLLSRAEVEELGEALSMTTFSCLLQEFDTEQDFLQAIRYLTMMCISLALRMFHES